MFARVQAREEAALAGAASSVMDGEQRYVVGASSSRRCFIAM